MRIELRFILLILVIVNNTSCYSGFPGLVRNTLGLIAINNNAKREIHKENKPDTVGKLAKIVFDSSAYHFGTVKQGELLNRTISFKNEGPADLIIDVISACECTTLDWSRLPIPAGTKSMIQITYNSKDKEGAQIVDIDITANTDPVSTFTKFYLFVEK